MCAMNNACNENNVDYSKCETIKLIVDVKTLTKAELQLIVDSTKGNKQF